ncbi:MAG: uracil-xanthine permease family protein [Spirochaetales bacterium]
MSDVATNEGLTGKTVVLGLQHTFVMFGATVLVPIITGLDVGVALFAAGIGTLIFHFLTKMKVPVFLGSSFSFMPPIIAVAEASGGDLAFATGGILVAGLVYVVVAVIFKFVNFKWLQLILPAHVTGPIIILIGLLLANVAINNASGNWWIAALTFAFGVFVKIGFERFGWKFLSALPILLALIFGYIISIVWGIVDFSSVNDAAWVGIPNFMLPKFSGSALALIVPVAIVTIVEHFGDVIAIGNVVKQNFLKDPGVHRTLLGDGIATSVSALLGGPANTTYSENTGAVALTGVKNPAVMRIAAVFAILLSLIPKFNALIGTIPGPVIGGISILLFGMISSIGIRNMIDARVNMDDPRPLIISAAMLVLGVGNAAFVVGGLTLSGLALSAIVGIVLNVLINFRSFKNASSEQPGAMG